MRARKRLPNDRSRAQLHRELLAPAERFVKMFDRTLDQFDIILM